MDIYVLSDSFRNESIVDKHQSFIWTERFSSSGDFELIQTFSDSLTSPVKIGKYIAISESHRVGKVDTSYFTMSDDGELLVKYTGLLIEKSVYSTRSIMPMVVPKYSWTGIPHDSESIETINGVETRRNRCKIPRFSLEGLETTAGFQPKKVTTNTFNATVLASNRGLRISGKADSIDTYAELGSLAFTPNKWYGIQAYLTLDEPQQGTLNARARSMAFFYRAGTTGDYSVIMSPQPPNIDGEPMLVEWVFRSPPNANYTLFRLYNGASSENGIVNWDELVIFQGDTEQKVRADLDKGYFDGDTAYLAVHPEAEFTAPIDQMLEYIIDETSLNNQNAPRENLPFGYGFPPGEPLDGYTEGLLPISDEEIMVSIRPTTVYDGLESTAKTLEQGFFIMRKPMTGELFTGGFGGTNRTMRQTLKDPILFSTELGNVTDLSELRSDRDTRKFAAVYGKNDMLVVDREGNTASHEDIIGLDRTIIPVDASDIDFAKNTLELEQALILRGQEVLLNQTDVNVLDGEITQTSTMVYEKDFAVGSMVTMQSISGVTSNMRVTEYTFISDENGQRSYPTLSIKDFIESDSWAGQPVALVWNDALGVWEEK